MPLPTKGNSAGAGPLSCSISAHPLILILLLAVPALLAAVPTAALVTPRQMMFRLTPARAPVMAATIMPTVPGAPSSAGWE